MNKFGLLVLGVILLVALSYAFTIPGGQLDPKSVTKDSAEAVEYE